jgi:hypothetical protein
MLGISARALPQGPGEDLGGARNPKADGAAVVRKEAPQPRAGARDPALHRALRHTRTAGYRLVAVAFDRRQQQCLAGIGITAWARS